MVQQAPALAGALELDFIVVNGENAAGGFGVTESIFEEFLAAGVDAVTLGNHAFDQREALVFIERQPRLIRPANYPPGTPGRGAAIVENAKGARAAGREPAWPDLHGGARRSVRRARPRARRPAPRRRLPRERGRRACRGDEREMGARPFADGRASLVVGTHTHVPSADHRILAGGTGFVTDVGMTGDYDSVIGMEKDEPLRRFTRRIPSGRFEPAMGPATLCAVAAEITAEGLTQGDRARAHRRPAQRPPSRTSGTERCMTPTIVYDLDGTLADTAGDLMGALNFVLGARASRRCRSRTPARCSAPAGGR